MAQSYRVDCLSPPRCSPIRCVLIADDLTGACDAAVSFRRFGATVQVVLQAGSLAPEDPAVPSADILAFSTDSRDVSCQERRIRHFNISARIPASKHSTTVIFKKIDSTLRGNPGAEIAAALDVFHCELAIIAPAFPAMGRQVRAGFLHSDRDPGWRPLHVATLLRDQGLDDCQHVSHHSVQMALSAGYRYLSLDTVIQEELEKIATEVLASRRRVLWVGSAGLASALASALFSRAQPEFPKFVKQPKPLLFAVGSNHVVTAEQIEALCQRFPVERLDANSASNEQLETALKANRNVLLSISRDMTKTDSLAALLSASRDYAGALLLSGGDTASLVCRALQARSISLAGEIVTGLPWGLLAGGDFDGVAVATKSGAFGSPHALIEIANFFSCLPL